MQTTLQNGDRIYPLGQIGSYHYDGLTGKLTSYDGAIIDRSGRFFHDCSTEYDGVEARYSDKDLSFRESFVVQRENDSIADGIEGFVDGKTRVPLLWKAIGLGFGLAAAYSILY